MVSQSFQLIMRSGPNPGKTFELKQSELTIGRDVGNHIVINDPEVSRKHARLIAQAGGYLIEDLGSTNGTFINGERLFGPHVLRHGEVVMLGEGVSLVYEAMQYDPDATLVSASAAQAGIPVRDTYVVPPTPPQTEPEPFPLQQPPPFRPEQPAYSDLVPPPTPEPYAAEPPYGAPPKPKKSSRTLLFVGIGCLVLLLCCIVVGALVFDTMDLYCEPPFDAIFSCP